MMVCFLLDRRLVSMVGLNGKLLKITLLYYPIVYGTPEGTFPFRYLSAKEIETRKLKRKSKQKISRLIDLLYIKRYNKSLKRYKIGKLKQEKQNEN